MFSLRNFIKNGFVNAIGNRPDYWIILNAAGWMEKGVLLEEDLADIQAALDAHAVFDTLSGDETAASDTPSGDEIADADAQSGTDDTPSNTNAPSSDDTLSKTE